MDICTFWYGERLRPVDWLCLSSMVKTGQNVKLYSYTPIADLPKGVKNIDASTILPFSVMYRLNPHFPNEPYMVTIVQFSDIFRVMLMKHQAGAWLDTDVFLIKPFLPKHDEVWLARENKQRVGVSALYFPPENPIIDEFDNYLKSNFIVPNWLGPVRGYMRPIFLKMKNKAVLPPKLGITVFGNDGISRLAKRYGFFENAKNKQSFYYWTGRLAENIFNPAFGLEPLNHPDLIGFHVHRKAKTSDMPENGCFYHWAISQIPEAKFLFEAASLSG